MPLPAEILKPYRVILTDAGPRKVIVAKLVYELARIDLKRALKLVKHPPSIVGVFDTNEDAEWLVQALQQTGALGVIEHVQSPNSTASGA
jgi:ribosomal protein L7/L12